MTERRATQHANLLASHGTTASEIKELLAYNRNVFDRSVEEAPALPLPAEPHVAAWERYAREAAEGGAPDALRRRLVQLQFPIREGISRTDAYRAATLRGASTQEMDEASGLDLARPDELRLGIHPSPAGPIPVLAPGGRADFVALVRPVHEERARTCAGVYGSMHGRGSQQLGPHQGVPASMGGRGWRSFGDRLATRVQTPRATKRTVPGQVSDPQRRPIQQRHGRGDRALRYAVAHTIYDDSAGARVYPLLHAAGLRFDAQQPPRRAHCRLHGHHGRRRPVQVRLVPALHGSGVVSGLQGGQQATKLPRPAATLRGRFRNLAGAGQGHSREPPARGRRPRVSAGKPGRAGRDATRLVWFQAGGPGGPRRSRRALRSHRERDRDFSRCGQPPRIK